MTVVDATTTPPTVTPAGTARHMGDFSLEDTVVSYRYVCAVCSTYIHVSAGEVARHSCTPEGELASPRTDPGIARRRSRRQSMSSRGLPQLRRRALSRR
jgi:hypothetical protein